MLGSLTTAMYYLVLQCGKTGFMFPPAQSCSAETASRTFSTQHSLWEMTSVRKPSQVEHIALLP